MWLGIKTTSSLPFPSGLVTPKCEPGKTQTLSSWGHLPRVECPEPGLSQSPHLLGLHGLALFLGTKSTIRAVKRLMCVLLCPFSDLLAAPSAPVGYAVWQGSSAAPSYLFTASRSSGPWPVTPHGTCRVPNLSQTNLLYALYKMRHRITAWFD